MTKTILITGGCGFIGHHLCEAVIKNTNWNIKIIDKLSYASAGFNRLKDINVYDDSRINIFTHDVTKPITECLVEEIGDIDYISHLSAYTHVDNSITNPRQAVLDNVLGTMEMLEFARLYQPNLKLFNYFSCYDEKTRALTKDGFKHYSELKIGDIVLSINDKTGKIEEKKIKKVIIQDYDGDMIKFKNRRCDLKVTPNHRMYIRNQNNEIEIINAEDCKEFKFLNGKFNDSDSSDFHISIREAFGKNLSSQDINDIFYLSGLFIGDGFTSYQEKHTKNKSGLTREEKSNYRDDKGKFIKLDSIGTKQKTICKSYRIYFDLPFNDPAHKKAKKALDRLGIKYTTPKNKSGEHIYIGSEKLLKFFDQFGKYAKNKHIPQWMLNFSASHLEKLFEGLIDSDGTNKNNYIGYTTISDKLKRDICELSIKIGYAPRFKKQKTEMFYEKEQRKISGEAWYLHFKEKEQIVKNHDISYVPYSGKIWCVTVEDNKNLVVERNGILSISGNTDEIFGPAPEGTAYKEWDRLNPTNPYSAGKAGGDAIALAYANTYGIPVYITNTMNAYGERQHPEKYIPKIINCVLNEQKLTIHSDPTMTKAGSRFYIHCRNIADAVLFLIDKSETQTNYKLRDKFNIVGEKEIDNLELAQLIASIIDKPLKYEMVDFHGSRPGHDLRYALDGTKMKELGWEPPKSFEESLEKTVRWYLEPNNKKWLEI